MTAIEWTDATWNPVTGCTRVSPGCAHCYIERQIPMRVAHRKFARVGNASTTGVQLHPERLKRVPKGPRIFVCSMSDLFHEDVPDAFIVSVFYAMMAADGRIYQVLTKRPERARDWSRRFYAALSELAGSPVSPIANVWLGTTIESARYTWRADVLRETPAAVRFVSAEPLLGSLFEERDGLRIPGRVTVEADAPEGGIGTRTVRAPLDLTAIDWLICGGESGPGYRPMQLEHARELRDACQSAGTAFFFKQWGGKTPKSGGKILDGREWCDYPVAA